jgi:hypothetical protein
MNTQKTRNNPKITLFMGDKRKSAHKICTQPISRPSKKGHQSKAIKARSTKKGQQSKAIKARPTKQSQQGKAINPQLLGWENLPRNCKKITL